MREESQNENEKRRIKKKKMLINREKGHKEKGVTRIGRSETRTKKKK